MGSSRRHDSVPHWFPTPVGLQVLTLAVVLLAAVVGKGPWDRDYFWHVTTGRLISERGLLHTDPFSFTWQGRPWVLHEWLSELAMYQMVESFGYLATMVIFGILPGVTVGVVALGMERMGLRTSAIVVGSSISSLVLLPYLTVRPQVISWLLFGLLISGLVLLRPARAPYVLLGVPLFALWANLHGLWVVGLAFGALYCVLTFLGMTPMREARRWALAGFLGAFIASALTPAGVRGMLYPLRYIEGGDWGLMNISEWQSPNFHDLPHLPLLLLMVAVAAVGRNGVPGWITIQAYAGIALALLALRNGPVAAIAAMPALILGFDSVMQQARQRTIRGSPFARRLLETGLAAIVAVSAWIVFVPPDPLQRVESNLEANLPVQGIEVLLEVRPHARVVASYGWGGYVISQVFPEGGLVMVDGRNDMYDQAILEEYGRVERASQDWSSIVDRYQVDAILFPPTAPIVSGVAQAAGWCEAYRDANEVLLLRTCPTT